MSGSGAYAWTRIVSKAISRVEDRAGGYQAVLHEAYRTPHWAEVIGITGPPGAGKSTLVDALAAHWGEGGARIAVLAVDPSSPFSGGAVLGDRIRMERSSGLDNVFFRSLSSRGHVGGMSDAACDIVALLSHFGYQRILIETVGAGQADIEVTGTADCTLVVTVPGLGDQVQALKAGIMEAGDVYAVNKSDLPRAATTLQQVDGMLDAAYAGRPGINPRLHSERLIHPTSPGVRALMRRHGDAWGEPSHWRPPVHAVIASANDGVAELAASIDAFFEWSRETDRLRHKRGERAYDQMLRLLTLHLLQPFTAGSSDEGRPPPHVAAWVERVVNGQASPHEAVEALLAARPDRSLPQIHGHP